MNKLGTYENDVRKFFIDTFGNEQVSTSITGALVDGYGARTVTEIKFDLQYRALLINKLNSDQPNPKIL